MRIAKNTKQPLTDAPSARFLLVVDVMDGPLTMEKEGRQLLHLALDPSGSVRATICYPDGKETTLLGEGAAGKEVILTAGYARVGLYVAGVLLDEDFFFVPLDYEGATLSVGSFSHFEAGYEYHSAAESAIVEGVAERLDGYRPLGTDYAVKRVIPVTVGERLYAFYLDERKGGRLKEGAGANKLCALVEDTRGICSAPIALPIDSVEEEGMRDASLLFHEGRYYLYYIVDYRSGRALSCAVSEDGYSFLKTGLDVEIPTVDNAAVTGIALLSAPTPLLYFVADGKAYFAESVDLLHFAPPVRLPLFDGCARVLPLETAHGVRLYASKDEALLMQEGDSLVAVSDAPTGALPVLFGDKLLLIGTKDGAIAVKEK